MSITLTGDIASIILGVSTFTGVIGSLYLQAKNLRQSVDNAKHIQITALKADANLGAIKETAQKVDDNMGAIRTTTQKVEAIHASTNGLTEQLVASTKIIAHAAGVKEEQERRAAVLDTSHVGTVDDPIHVQLVPHDAGAQDDLQWAKPK